MNLFGGNGSIATITLDFAPDVKIGLAAIVVYMLIKHHRKG